MTEVWDVLGKAGHTGSLVLLIDPLSQSQVEEEICHILEGRLERVELPSLVDQDSLVSGILCPDKLALQLAEVEESFKDDLRGGRRLETNFLSWLLQSRGNTRMTGWSCWLVVVSLGSSECPGSHGERYSGPMPDSGILREKWNNQ